jgi:hypothetical protein
VLPATGAENGLPHEPQPCCTEQRSEKPLNRLEKIKEFTDAFSPWVLVIIGLLGVVAALWTLSAIHQQARDNLVAITAARASAHAATQSAEAFVHSERAWIVVNNKYPPRIVDFLEGHAEIRALELEIINSGRTPGRFTGTVRINSKLTKIEDLPAVPDFSPAWPGAPAESEFTLSPKEKRRFKIPIIPTEKWDAVSKGRGETPEGQRLFVYASFLYYAFGDLIGELGICYCYFPERPWNKPHGFIRMGPKGYNKQT